MDITKFKIKHIVPLLIVICSITLVCASFNQDMVVSGEGYVRVNREIRVVGIERVSTTSGVTEKFNPRYAKDSVTMGVDLGTSASAQAVYEVTVENKSNSVYVISEIYSQLTNSNITYTVSNYTIGQGIDRATTASGAGTVTPSVVKFRITIKYKSTTVPTNHEQTANIFFRFEKPRAEQLSYVNTQSGTSCTDVQCALDELYTLLS